jgi:hypothetical protein
MKQRGILLKADPPYSITDDETGEVKVSGMKCVYFPDETLEHYQSEVRGQIHLGIKPYSITLPISCFEKLVSVPGMYDFKMEYTDVKQTKEFNGEKTNTTVQGVVPVDIEFVGNIKLSVDKPK